jgi:hypothetical protein
MAQTFTEVKTPFTNMSFTPDVPASALGSNEYNSGFNVETDTRGIKSVLGDETILNQLTGTPIYVTGGYRDNDVWWFVIGCVGTSGSGHWYAMDEAGITEITPSGGLTGYYIGMPITDAWNGNVLFLNDSVTAPMFLLSDGTQLQQYSQNSNTVEVTGASGNGTTVTLTFATQASVPYQVGSSIIVSGIDPVDYNGTWVVTACTTTTVSFLSTSTDTYNSGGTIVPLYLWNYNPNWKSVTAGWMRMYSSPNVGSILIAGNLTAVDQSNTVINYPVTVQWSQAFGLNSGPTSWAPTLTNIANQLEIPARGPALDGFNVNGNFYVCSYWDTVVFSPIAYQSTSAPIFGLRIFNQGRGLLNENCWDNADFTVYGVDARDFWSFDGNNFTGIGNQKVKNYFFNNLNPLYVDRVFAINNTQKYQMEWYYPDLTSTGTCNQMISYRYDLQIWNPPRAVTNALSACETPVWNLNGNIWSYNNGSRTVVYCQGTANSYLAQKDQTYTFLNNQPISSKFRRDNIQLCKDFSQQALLHRTYPEIVVYSGNANAVVNINIGGSNSTGQTPTLLGNVSMSINTNNPWTQFNQNAFRLNTIEVNTTSSDSQWELSAMNWQFTPTQDQR